VEFGISVVSRFAASALKPTPALAKALGRRSASCAARLPRPVSTKWDRLLLTINT
jgi:hypothetical protein